MDAFRTDFPDRPGADLQVRTAVYERGEEIALHATPMHQVQKILAMTEPRTTGLWRRVGRLNALQTWEAASRGRRGRLRRCHE
jgi:hypothetical protein